MRVTTFNSVGQDRNDSRNAETDLDDAALIAAVQIRDRLALEKLYLGYYQRLARFLARFTARRENAEEIINDTFMVVWMHANGFRCESRVSTWIFGIVFRTAMRSLRQQRKHSSVQSVETVPEQTSNPTQEYMTKDWLDCALTRLPAEQRLTLTLAYQIGFSVEEIAAITHSPIGTVKSRMFHARLKLRHELLVGEHGSPPGHSIAKSVRVPT
jgi:RNA polymerase sigma-70 factor, ECF subfamily